MDDLAACLLLQFHERSRRERCGTMVSERIELLPLSIQTLVLVQQTPRLGIVTSARKLLLTRFSFRRERSRFRKGALRLCVVVSHDHCLHG